MTTHDHEHGARAEAVSLHLMVGRIEGKLDAVLKDVEGHGPRIATLEAWKNRLLGAVLVSGAGNVAALWGPIKSALGGH